ncbi:MAG: ABC transporter permease, partial [Gammaproteobacteria bacterium]
MLSVLSRASRNFLLRHPWQLALAVLGITLGVAVVIAIDLALESSLRTFERAAGAVSGKASHRVVAADGGLDESLYVRLRVARGVENISPVVQGVVALKTDPEKTLRLYGVDPFVEGDFRSEWRRDQDGDDGALSKLMTEANAVLLNRTTAARLRVGKGGRFAVATERGEAELTVAEISA